MLLGKKRSHPSTSMMKSGIVDSQSKLSEQRAKEIMTLFEEQTELTPNEDQLPTAQLKSTVNFSTYNTPLLKQYSTDIQLIWSLATALFQKENGVQHWIRDLVYPGLDSQLEFNEKQHAHDPFVSVFTYLSYGQRDLACREAKNLHDFQLAMYITHTEFKDVRDTVKHQIDTFRSNGQWQTMTHFHKQSWRTISGDLGYSDLDGKVVTERVMWQCALGMYLWYGNRYGDTPYLLKYNRAIDNSIPDIHHLTTVKNTAAPDRRCLWYQLLQWWLGDQKLAHMDSWPLDLVWLLSVYKKESNGINESYALQWIQDLERMDQAEWAIYAAFFLSRPAEKVNYILRQCEWNDEQKLLNQYHIPRKSIFVAKALNAHDDWDFGGEYKILLQGQLCEQAKMSLLYFVLPRYFSAEENAIEKCLYYLNQYPEEQDQDVKVVTQACHYISQNEEKNQEKSNTLIEQLVGIQPKYGGKNTGELFSNLIEAIKLK